MYRDGPRVPAVVTLVLYGVLAIVLAGVLFVVAARLLPAGEQIAPPVRDEPVWELPADQRLLPGDVEAVRLPVALRGYRFAETDLLLDRLAAELRARDGEIARLLAERDEAAESWVPAPRAGGDPAAVAGTEPRSDDPDAGVDDGGAGDASDAGYESGRVGESGADESGGSYGAGHGSAGHGSAGRRPGVDPADRPQRHGR